MLLRAKPHQARRGFTLIELMAAMAISLVIINTAFLAMNQIRKCVVAGETIGARNDVVQSQILWLMTQRPAGAYPSEVQNRGVSGGFLGYRQIRGHNDKYTVADLNPPGAQEIKLTLGQQRIFPSTTSSGGAAEGTPSYNTGEPPSYLDVGGDGSHHAEDDAAFQAFLALAAKGVVVQMYTGQCYLVTILDGHLATQKYNPGGLYVPGL